MKVLILGASGFIGHSVAVSFLRAGHIVYGQTRSSESAKRLAKGEILPVVCDPLTDAGRKVWGEVVKQADVVIDCLKSSGVANALGAFEHFLGIVSSRPKGSPRATYIYTSGLWVSSRGPGGLDSWTDERQPRSELNAPVQWRAEIEDRVLGEDSVNGIVIRGPMMYGYDGTYIASYFFEPALKASRSPAGEKVFEAVARAEARWLTIHADDLGDLFLACGERAPICKGQVFFGGNPQTERLTDIIDAVVRVSGCEGYKMVEGSEPFDKMWTSTLNIKPSLAHALTGWYPKRMSLVDGMDLYWASYLASKE